MGIIKVEGIKLYAYHGCLEEEAIIGGEYIVDVTMNTDFTAAAEYDDLELTVDYVKVYEIVKKQMAMRSKLIEQVGQRIYKEISSRFKNVVSTEVKITKINPPVNGYVERVSVTITQ